MGNNQNQLSCTTRDHRANRSSRVSTHVILIISAYTRKQSDWIGVRGILTQNGDVYLWTMKNIPLNFNSKTGPCHINVKKLVTAPHTIFVLKCEKLPSSNTSR